MTRRAVTRRSLLLTATTGLVALGAMPRFAFGASYPERSLDWIVMWRSGGGADIATRTFTKPLENILKREIVVKNITGGGGSIGYTAAKSAKPDGYTLVTLQGDLPKFEPMGLAPIAIDDFDVIAGFAFQSPVVVVRADSPWKTLQEFVAAAKQNPNKYSIGVTDIGGVYHQPMVLWEEAAGFKATPVTLQGSPQQTVALLGGHVDALVTWVKPNLPYVKDGKLRFLGYMASERGDAIPDVPTLRELGQDVVWEHPYGVGGPKGVPEEAKKVLADATRRIWDLPEFKDGLEKLGLSVLRLDGPAYAKHLKRMQSDMKKAIALIKQ